MGAPTRTAARTVDAAIASCLLVVYVALLSVGTAVQGLRRRFHERRSPPEAASGA